MSYPIRNSTMTNGIVLDPFLGSGSTLIACEETDGYAVALSLTPNLWMLSSSAISSIAKAATRMCMSSVAVKS